MFVGVSANQVKSILGKPLKIFTHDESSMFYVYSRAKKMEIDFYSKQVVFKDVKVVGKFSSLYYEMLY
jgi:outer membrane protein assembly factor BamE (lipoprotein component of BamABCDE complex)